MLNKLFRKIKKNKKELIILAVLLLISGITHGYNMFHFPYYENDEGTYMSQAWSLLTQGKLAPYTYWYDHAPAGWILIALWVKLTGGFFTFGTSVNSGRVLMLLLHLGTSFLLFYVAKKLSKGYLASILAVLIFSLSPLGIYFQRRVLLDNIMVFWVFLSLALLLRSKLRLSHIVVSAVSFGVAVLTKENAVFFLPAFIYLLFSRAHRHHKEFALVKWLTVAGSVISIYFLYALLKGELFPVGFLGDTTNNVSLITAMREQLSRGNRLLFWNKDSDFYVNLIGWFERDAFIIIAGGLATLISVVVSIKDKSLRVPALLAILFWLFLMRGKLVINFYIIPLVPLLSLNIGVLASFLSQKLSFNKKPVRYLLAGLVLAPSIYFPLGQTFDHYVRDETTPQVKTIDWLKTSLPESSSIIIDNSIYVDLHERRFPDDKVFNDADWAWKVEKDPEILRGKLQSDWKNIEYIALTHEILRQIKDYKFNFIQKAFDNSYLVKDWKEGSTSYVDLKNYISTNGDWMAIYKVKDEHSIALDNSWKFYKGNFIKSYGQIVNPNNNDATTSEGQSYAMLRAVWQDDRATFDGVWAWTQDHLQYRTQDKLFSWLWVRGGDNYKLGDSASASDADQDTALALIFAYKRWGDKEYLEAAKAIMADIWKQEVVLIDNRYYLTSGTGAGRDDGFLVNPSYLSPAHYRVFADIDKQHPWEKLADDSYYLLNKLGEQKGNNIYLPPNWLLVDRNTGDIASASKHISDEDVDNYGFDAFRTIWRVGLDAVWFNSPEAIKYLEKVSPFFIKQWKSGGKIAAVYTLDGKPKTNFESLSTNAGTLSVLTVTNRELAGEVYSELFDKKFNYDEGYWGDKNNYYDQNWAWFAIALYSGNLPNYWEN